MITLCSADPEPGHAHEWMLDVLVWSAQNAGHGPITVLRDGDPERGSYPPLNKPYAIARWLERYTGAEDETVLVVDPDCVFTAPVTRPAYPGHPWATWFWYCEATYGSPQTPGDSWLPRLGIDPATLQPVGVPLGITVADLRLVAEPWSRWTRRVLEAVGEGHHYWIAEMWGYIIAAAEAGLQHDDARLMAHTGDEEMRDVLHYCYPYERDTFTFNKWHGKPSQILAPPADAPSTIHAIATAINITFGLEP